MSNLELSQRADLALSDLTANGGVLQPMQADTFIRNLIDAPTMLGLVRTVPMTGPTMKLNKIGFGSRITRAARQSGGQNDDGSNNRYMRAADRVKPDLGQVNLETKEITVEINLPYEVLEDNIERGNLQNTLLTLMAQRVALDLEELLLLGDTALAGSDPYLGLFDGILKLSTAHVVDAGGAAADVSLWNAMKKALPTKYRRVLKDLGYFVAPDVESDWRVRIASRQGGLGDAVLTGSEPIPVLGSKMQAPALMPLSQALYGDPQNFIFGVQRNIRIEQDRDIRSREIIIVLTARVAIQVQEADAVVKAINIG